VNGVSAQLTGVFVCGLSIVCAIFAEQWWCRILIAAMFTDTTLRILFGGRGKPTVEYASALF
jgi:hypothetical protein